jgi:hypothetical protein
VSWLRTNATCRVPADVARVVKLPEAPEPGLDGIELMVLPGPHTYVEGCFGPGAAGLISALEERGIAVAAVVRRRNRDIPSVQWE